MSELKLSSGDIQYYKQLAKFKSREDMDLAVRSFLYTYKRELTKAEQNIVKICSQLSYKLKGVFWIKLEKIASLASVSPKTIQRAFKKLKDLGFLTVYGTIRPRTAKKAGGKGHNVYVINAIELNENILNDSKSVQSNVQSKLSSRPTAIKADTPTVEQVKSSSDSRFSDSKPSKRFNKTIVQPDDNNRVSESDMIPDYIPEKFASLAMACFNNSSDVEKSFKIIRKSILKHYPHLSDEDKSALSIRSILAYFRSVKKGVKITTTWQSYIWGIAKKIGEVVFGDHNVWGNSSNQSESEYEAYEASAMSEGTRLEEIKQRSFNTYKQKASVKPVDVIAVKKMMDSNFYYEEAYYWLDQFGFAEKQIYTFIHLMDQQNITAFSLDQIETAVRETTLERHDSKNGINDGDLAYHLAFKFTPENRSNKLLSTFESLLIS